MELYEKELEIFGGLKDLRRKVQLNNYKEFKDFLDKHTSSRTYSFHIFKCSDPLCIYHDPLRGDPIERFGEPVPHVEDSNMTQHYVEGSDPEEKHLPSKSANPEKQGHNMPFPPSAQTAKNVGMTVKCHECGKQRLLYANKVVKAEERLRFKRLQNDYVYICGGSFNEIHVSNTNKDSKISENIFTRENLSCSSNIEIPYYSAGYKNICIFVVV